MNRERIAEYRRLLNIVPSLTFGNSSFNTRSNIKVGGYQIDEYLSPNIFSEIHKTLKDRMIVLSNVVKFDRRVSMLPNGINTLVDELDLYFESYDYSHETICFKGEALDSLGFNIIMAIFNFPTIHENGSYILIEGRTIPTQAKKFIESYYEKRLQIKADKEYYEAINQLKAIKDVITKEDVETIVELLKKYTPTP